MSRPDPHAEHLRREIEGCRRRREALEANRRTFDYIDRTLRELGEDPTDGEGFASKAARYRAEALQNNMEAEETFRGLLARHLVRTADDTVQPIDAPDDDAALSALLASVGGRIPGEE